MANSVERFWIQSVDCHMCSKETLLQQLNASFTFHRMLNKGLTIGKKILNNIQKCEKKTNLYNKNF